MKPTTTFMVLDGVNEENRLGHAPEERFKFGRGSRERRTPLSEIVTDTPPIWQRDTGQPRRCAMVRPRHKGTPYVIEVTLRPGKYELHSAR